jgi:hypothetical protein
MKAIEEVLETVRKHKNMSESIYGGVFMRAIKFIIKAE